MQQNRIGCFASNYDNSYGSKRDIDSLMYASDYYSVLSPTKFQIGRYNGNNIEISNNKTDTNGD